MRCGARLSSDVPLVVEHHDVRVVSRALDERIGADRTSATMPSRLACSSAGSITSISSRPNAPDSPAWGLTPLTAIFGCAMPSHEGVAHGTHRLRHSRDRDLVERRSDARCSVRCAMRISRSPWRKQSMRMPSSGASPHTRATNEGTVEVDAGGMNGRFGVRRTDHGGEAPSSAARILLRRGERGAAVARRDAAELGQLLLDRRRLEAFERQAAGAACNSRTRDGRPAPGGKYRVRQGHAPP